MLCYVTINYQIERGDVSETNKKNNNVSINDISLNLKQYPSEGKWQW